MTALIFNDCCGCIELRTGCLIIGYLNLIADIILIIVGIICVRGAVILEYEKDKDAGTAAVLAAVILTVTILILGFIIALLVGIHKNKRRLVKASLIFSVICIFCYVLAFFLSFSTDDNSALNIVLNLFQIILNVYFLLVLRSYYYKMDTSGPSYNTA